MKTAAGQMSLKNIKDCAVIVAHPDDETLWAGGLILSNPQIDWEIIALSRRSDADRNPKFLNALKFLAAIGNIGDIDDSSEQPELESLIIQSEIAHLLTKNTYDLIISHNPLGEYTRHKRHEQTSIAVLNMLETSQLDAKTVWLFAYQDNSRKILPTPMDDSDVKIELDEKIWQRKYHIINKVYGFNHDSWEAQTTPKTESFWCFENTIDLKDIVLERSNLK